MGIIGETDRSIVTVGPHGLVVSDTGGLVLKCVTLGKEAIIAGYSHSKVLPGSEVTEVRS